VNLRDEYLTKLAQGTVSVNMVKIFGFNYSTKLLDQSSDLSKISV
jgi:hypothetical protein